MKSKEHTCSASCLCYRCRLDLTRKDCCTKRNRGSCPMKKCDEFLPEVTQIELDDA